MYQNHISPMNQSEKEAVRFLTHYGRYEEIVTILKHTLQRTDNFSQDRIAVLTHMAETLCFQEKFAEAKICAEEVIGILDKKDKTEPPSLDVAVGFARIVNVYESAKEFHMVISLLKRVSPILEKLPIEIYSSNPFLEDVSLKIGLSLCSIGKSEEAILYLKEGVEIMIKNYGFSSSKVGLAYAALGSAYFDSNKKFLGAEVFNYVKNILDESLGLYHEESMKACKCLCRAYLYMRRHSLAIKILGEYIERLEVLGPNKHDELVRATSLMTELKGAANTTKKVITSSLSDDEATKRSSQSDTPETERRKRKLNV